VVTDTTTDEESDRELDEDDADCGEEEDDEDEEDDECDGIVPTPTIADKTLPSLKSYIDPFLGLPPPQGFFRIGIGFFSVFRHLESEILAQALRFLLLY
jgi:hypothetical protein